MKIVRDWNKVYLADLSDVASELKDFLSTPTCIILTGEVGMGKTSFVQNFLPHFQITSPSYSLVNEVGNIAHADFYRIKNESEITELELELYLEGKDYFLIEWGKDYLSNLRREIPTEFSFYELKIKLNRSDEAVGGNAPRSFHLYELD